MGTYYDSILYGNGIESYAPIIRLVAELCYRLGSPELFFITTATASMFFIVSAIYRTSSEVSISLFVFITFPLLFLDSLIIVRYFLAFSILLYGATFLQERRIFTFLIYLLVASLVHVAAVIGLIFLIPYFFKINNYLSLLLFLLAFLIARVSKQYVASFVVSATTIGEPSASLERFSRYVNGGSDANLQLIPILFYSINIFNLIFRKRLFNTDDVTVDSYLSIMNIGCCLMLIFSFENSMSSRFSIPFIAFFMFIADKYKNRSLAVPAIMALGILLFVYALTVDAHHPLFQGRRNSYLPYKLIFFK